MSAGTAHRSAGWALQAVQWSQPGSQPLVPSGTVPGPKPDPLPPTLIIQRSVNRWGSFCRDDADGRRVLKEGRLLREGDRGRKCITRAKNAVCQEGELASHSCPHRSETGGGSIGQFSKRGEDIQRCEQIEAANIGEARERANAMEDAWREERVAARKASKRRHKAAAAERAQELEHRRLKLIEEQIAETSAEGLAGVAVLMALWQHYNWDHSQWYDPEDFALSSAYAVIVKLTGGVDLAAQVERW
jgi:hypothetical protein